MTDAFLVPTFGTDGLRGRAGEPPMDPETLRRVGAALGVLLQKTGGDQKRAIVGNDGRESAPWILESIAQGLAAADVAVADIGLCTTPALSFLTRTQPYDAGIMISASHNPAHDNGVKIFGHDGRKLRDEDEREIELLTASLRPERPRTPRCKDAAALLVKYQEHLVNAFSDLDLGGMKLCVDAANGGGSQLAPLVLRAFGAEVVEVACEPDGFNIDAGVGALHPEVAAAAVREHRAHLGICLDGDGDRGIFVDEDGNVHDGDAQLCLFGRHLHAQGRLPHATVVATVMSNLGLHQAMREQGIRVHVTPVGDRNVVQAMRTHGYALGGEQSGHLLFDVDGHLSGDGLFTALQLLSLPSARQTGFAAAFAAFRRFPQELVNVPVAHKPVLATVPAIAAKVAEIEQRLGDRGRLLLRYSGTEPLCRVMLEGENAEEVRALSHELADIVRRELA
jgi:phosphoglucosamine mutase